MGSSECKEQLLQQVDCCGAEGRWEHADSDFTALREVQRGGVVGIQELANADRFLYAVE